jgi:Na+/proline symporter
MSIVITLLPVFIGLFLWNQLPDSHLVCVVATNIDPKSKIRVASVISGFVIDLDWLLTGLTVSTGVFEIVPGFFGSLIVAVIVAKLTTELSL